MAMLFVVEKGWGYYTDAVTDKFGVRSAKIRYRGKYPQVPYDESVQLIGSWAQDVTVYDRGGEVVIGDKELQTYHGLELLFDKKLYQKVKGEGCQNTVDKTEKSD